MRTQSEAVDPKQPDAEGGRRRLAPEARRAEVLAAALAVFTELGFEWATLQDVADRAGVTKGALYHYFDSKNELFLELMRERVKAHVTARDALVAAAAPTKPREELLRELLKTIWSHVQQPGMLDLIKLMMTELPKFPEIGRSFFAELVVPARRTMRQVWDRDGAIADDRLLDAIVAVLPGMMLGVALNRHMFRGIDTTIIDADRAGDLVVEILLQGALAVAAEGGPPPRSA